MDENIFREGISLYAERPDKTWGLVDCVSFAVMRRHAIQDAFTADRHFIQAGFTCLLTQPHAN